MKKYRVLSKVILAICLCGIILAIINGFTGIINSSIQISGTVICISGFLIAGVAIMLLENARVKKEQRNIGIGCTTSGSETDYPAAIMVDGDVYYLVSESMAGEVDDSAILGHTLSYTDTFPQKDGETNFNRELEIPYVKVTEGIAVFYENEWHLCTPED